MKSSLYDLVELEGKGVGCIASQDIEKGTVILCEKPQFAVKGKVLLNRLPWEGLVFLRKPQKLDEIFHLI